MSADQWPEPDERYADIGCASCDQGWRHGCMDDMCRGSVEACDCGDAVACRHCNIEGKYPL